MCGRYFIEENEPVIARIVAEAEKSALLGAHKFNAPFIGGEIFPGNTVPVLAGNSATFMIWGFPSLFGKQPHINARSETAASARTFAEAMAERRCLVPASGYYEWQKTGPKRKEKYEFGLSERAPFYMAGIFSSDGRFAILTREAVPALAEIHDRMPVIIPHRLKRAWLHESATINETVIDLNFAPVAAKTSGSAQLSLF